MAVTKEQVVDILLPEEPDFSEASSAIGPDALPYLRDLISGDDIHLAVKAASFAGFLASDDAVDVVRLAASHPDPRVRCAAAAGARNLRGTGAADVVAQMLADDDVGVRKFALRAVPTDVPDSLRKQIETIRANDENPSLRTLAARVLEGA